MELYIIRHGQSTNNALADPKERDRDPSLTEIGFKQADFLARYLSESIQGYTHPPVNLPITKLYCSPMRRALQTACPVGEALGLAPEVWIDIHESGGIYLDHGEEEGVRGYPGMTRGEVLADFPHYVLPDALTEEGWWKGGREDQAACHARAIRVAHALQARATTDERIALISHGGFIDALIKALLSQLPGTHLAYHHHNTAITRIDFREDGRLDIRYLNRVDHLPAELIT
ncbi:MAG: histidine phosphatase family protein [Anaerolineae bacterium]|nr:histidine phosphatase family protein [Anaerolineae bacterium]